MSDEDPSPAERALHEFLATRQASGTIANRLRERGHRADDDQIEVVRQEVTATMVRRLRRDPEMDPVGVRKLTSAYIRFTALRFPDAPPPAEVLVDVILEPRLAAALPPDDAQGSPLTLDAPIIVRAVLGRGGAVAAPDVAAVAALLGEVELATARGDDPSDHERRVIMARAFPLQLAALPVRFSDSARPMEAKVRKSLERARAHVEVQARRAVADGGVS